ncbi:MAG: PilZ domain-containing protein [Candidatus Latescibacterota bacterium]
MSEKRKLHRSNLIYYLKVIDRDTDALLGHLVDITSEGIMLISEKPIPEKILYNLRLEFPHEIFGQETLDFSALSLWCRPDLNPVFHDTGFKLQDVPLEHVLTIKKLVSELGFND